MEFIPSVFIGSSKEGKKVAQQIEQDLAGFVQCRLWMDAFDFGVSNYDNLMRQVAFYDYAILIATADDLLESRGQTFKNVRDNVLFEFGMFAGGLGKNRVQVNQEHISLQNLSQLILSHCHKPFLMNNPHRTKYFVH